MKGFIKKSFPGITVWGLAILFVCASAAAVIGRPGERAPVGFMLAPLSGGSPEIFSKYLEGGPVVVSFWASYCQPCAREMPQLEALVKKYPNIKLIFVNIDKRTEQGLAKQLLLKWGITSTVLADPYQAGVKQYTPAMAVPATFVIGADQKILYESIGFSEETLGALENILRGI